MKGSKVGKAEYGELCARIEEEETEITDGMYSYEYVDGSRITIFFEVLLNDN
jgi:hypothetical protein